MSHVDRDLRYSWIYNPHPDFDPAAIVGKRDDELAVNEGTRQLTELKRHVIQTGTRQHAEITFSMSDGERTWELQAEPVIDVNGEVVGATTVAFDVTPQKHAQQALRDSEQKYRQLFDQSIVPMSLITPEGRLIEANDAWFSLVGYSREDAASFNAANLFPEPGMREEFVRCLLREGTLDNYESQARKKDGTLIDVVRSISVRYNPDGSVLGFQSVLRDATARKQAERALRESEEKYRSLFEMSRDAIYLVRPDGMFIYVNQAWLDLLGCTRDDVSKYDASHWYANPDERARYLERMAKAGTMLDDEVKLRRKDGTVFDCQRRIVAQQDKDGNTIAFHGVMRDITEKKRRTGDARKRAEVPPAL